MLAKDEFDGLFSGKAPTERSAIMQTGMLDIFEMYTGALSAGFNPVQAMQIVLAFITKS
jgi:ABC-type iron transport system FetAB permease component